MKLHENFCRKVEEALDAKGWSKTDLSRAMGLSRQMIGDYCHGRKCPGLDVVERFAAALEVEPWNLVDDQPVRICTPVG